MDARALTPVYEMEVSQPLSVLSHREYILVKEVTGGKIEISFQEKFIFSGNETTNK